MAFEHFQKIFYPGSVAFAGVSNNLKTAGTSLFLSILAAGYKQSIYPVHPGEREIFGIKTYPSFLDIPESPDLAIFVVHHDILIKLLEECGRKGIKQAVVITAGYNETGAKGRAREKELLETAGRYGIRFIGPNCIGVLNPWHNFNCTWFPYTHQPGYMGIISQSGSFVTQMLPFLAGLGIGVSKGVSVGNQSNIDTEECLEYFGSDEQTRAIALYLEGLKRPRAFFEIAAKVTQKKPIVVYYVGGTEAGARAGISHTGILAGKDKLMDGLFKHAGILRAPDSETLYYWAGAMSILPPMKGNRVAIISNSGGPGAAFADSAQRSGLVIPEFSQKLQSRIKRIIADIGSAKNPIDMTMDLNIDSLMKILPEIVIESGEVDGILHYGFFGPIHHEVKLSILDKKVKGLAVFETKTFSAYERAAKDLCALSSKHNFPIISASFHGSYDPCQSILRNNGIPVMPSPEKAAQTLGTMWRYTAMQENKNTKSLSC